MSDAPKRAAAINDAATRDPSVGNDGDDTTGEYGPAPAFAAAADPAELGQLGPYRILKMLGRGGMGAVYLGFDSRLNRQLALKVMLPKFAANPAARQRPGPPTFPAPRRSAARGCSSAHRWRSRCSRWWPRTSSSKSRTRTARSLKSECRKAPASR